MQQTPYSPLFAFFSSGPLPLYPLKENIQELPLNITVLNYFQSNLERCQENSLGYR